jgi:hypothetical protein
MAAKTGFGRIRVMDRLVARWKAVGIGLVVSGEKRRVERVGRSVEWKEGMPERWSWSSRYLHAG